ncbi:MAG: P-II family nitrogen regulator [Eubacterium sp.]|nr:P-II family nitrogen regulator [Eubacterium sp.]
MKKLEIIVKPNKVEKAKMVLVAEGIGGAMFTNINGFGTQKGKTYTYNGVSYEEHIFPKVKVECVVSDEKVEPIIEAMTREVSDGEIGDGKIFIYDIENAVRVRTGERGEKAI